MGCGCGRREAQQLRKDLWKESQKVSEVEKLPEMPAEISAGARAWLKECRAKTDALAAWAKDAGDGPEKRRFLGVLGALNRDLLVLEQFVIKKA